MQISRFARLVLPLCFFLSSSAFAQSSATTSAARSATIEFAEKAAFRALNFQEGNLGSLAGAKNNFTAAAWKDYMKQLEGFLDAKGAPEFTSEFVPSGPAAVSGQDAGITYLTIPGKLVQTHLKSRTTYRIVVTVQIGGDPPRIQKLEQATCGGASANPACK